MDSAADLGLPATSASSFAPGGLAAIPVPEPHPLLLQAVGGLAVAALARGRRLRRTRA